MGWLLTQIISRRGPGSLRRTLQLNGWVEGTSNSRGGVPRITFPVDVDGFQVLRMEVGMTLEGFSNRSAFLVAVFESLRRATARPLQLDLIKQYLSAGMLHGYLFAPRPPDSVTLAVSVVEGVICATLSFGERSSSYPDVLSRSRCTFR